MSRYTAVLALYPGIHGKPYCSVWVGRGHALMDTSGMAATDTTVRTDDPHRHETAPAEADKILASAGYKRTGEWERVMYSLQAPCKRSRGGQS
jgi:hypothetical protein